MVSECRHLAGGAHLQRAVQLLWRTSLGTQMMKWSSRLLLQPQQLLLPHSTLLAVHLAHSQPHQVAAVAAAWTLVATTQRLRSFAATLGS